MPPSALHLACFFLVHLPEPPCVPPSSLSSASDHLPASGTALNTYTDLPPAPLPALVLTSFPVPTPVPPTVPFPV